MQDVTRAIEHAQKHLAAGEVEELPGASGDMLVAAQKWSKASLETFSGELLRKAMLLAAAMSEFAHEAADPS